MPLPTARGHWHACSGTPGTPDMHALARIPGHEYPSAGGLGPATEVQRTRRPRCSGPSDRHPEDPATEVQRTQQARSSAPSDRDPTPWITLWIRRPRSIPPGTAPRRRFLRPSAHIGAVQESNLYSTDRRPSTQTRPRVRRSRSFGLHQSGYWASAATAGRSV